MALCEYHTGVCKNLSLNFNNYRSKFCMMTSDWHIFVFHHYTNTSNKNLIDNNGNIIDF